MGFSAKFHDDGRTPSWALHDLGKEGRAAGTPFQLNGRAPSWALHNFGWYLTVFLVIVKLRGC